ncbi:hypothetical protein ColTof4_14030 [Colletotrichum tofieldiae]|nr:hypothetical protein ColTof3_14666 [Colletotrichum tofieldiae]GKT81607.1 hypothetical protein ColTof4_14030 [Colletotrichum tofieldiae]GKT97582.1 hypothetical protein Ct61P_15432 [Colletotrichum tofieldiae]
MSYVGPEEIKMLVKPNGRPSLRIAEPIWNSTVSMLVLVLGEHHWALTVVQYSREKAHEINLLDPLPSAVGALDEVFVDAERRVDALKDELEKATCMKSFASPKTANNLLPRSDFDKLTTDTKHASLMLELLKETLQGLQSLSNKINEFNMSVSQKTAPDEEDWLPSWNKKAHLCRG